MMSYKLTFFDDFGKKKNKIINIENEGQLQPYITAMNLNVIEISSIPYKESTFKMKLNSPKKKQVIEILENLQVIVQSGLSMNNAITDLAEDADTEFLKDMLLDISHRIQMSMSLSEAMKKYEYVFGETTIGLVKIGEETGQLDETLSNAAEYMKRMDSLTSKVKSALISPAITLVVLLGAMLIWIIKILPTILNVFVDLEVELPTVTVIFLHVINLIKSNGLYLVVMPIALTFLFFYFRKKSDSFRYASDKRILAFPIIGNILMLYNFAFVAEYTRLMIAAGLPLFQALGILKESLGNRVFRVAIEKSRQSISDGSSLSKALAEQKLFKPLIIRMINVGERTGRLEGQLKYISSYYFERVDYISNNIAEIIQPFVTVILGLFMLVMVVAFLMPVFELVSKMSTM